MRKVILVALQLVVLTLPVTISSGCGSTTPEGTPTTPELDPTLSGDDTTTHTGKPEAGMDPTTGR
ncbi:MAG: hypothetical protein KDA89_14490 [Planctomycetaceae bacterium]|nr:hypothetical protein [Planctomycetaceae bacterium]